jgi:UDP-glucose 4-epimerase
MKSLVTGGAGFIGSHLVDALLARGDRVRVLDDFSSGYRENLTDRDIDLVEGSILDADALARAVADIDVVFHIAAFPSVPKSIDHPADTTRVTEEGTIRVLDAARHAGVRRVICASSSAVYGSVPTPPLDAHSVVVPDSHYGAAKLGGESYCRTFRELFGLETASVRFFNVYGPRQDPASDYAAVMPRFFTACLSGEPPTIFGDGGQTRDFIYVGDVVSGLIAAADTDTLPDQPLVLSTGVVTTIRDLAEAVVAVTGSDVTPVHAEERAGDIRDSFADPAETCSTIGWKAETTLQAGLEATLAWFRNQ